jgi:hypothetical protein
MGRDDGVEKSGLDDKGKTPSDGVAFLVVLS